MYEGSYFFVHPSFGSVKMRMRSCLFKNIATKTVKLKMTAEVESVTESLVKSKSGITFSSIHRRSNA